MGALRVWKPATQQAGSLRNRKNSIHASVLPEAAQNQISMVASSTIFLEPRIRRKILKANNL